MRINKLVVILIVFFFASLVIGLFLVKEPQDISEKAATNMCPSAEACPYPGQPSLLRSCHPGESDGSVSESLCNVKGRIETCGPNTTKYCCPGPNQAWTTNMTACATPTPTPSPTPTKSPTPTPTRSPSPTPTTRSYPNWDVNMDGVTNIVDIGIVVENYERLPIVNQRADVNRDQSVDILDIGIIIDHYNR